MSMNLVGGAEPIPGFQLIERLGRGGFGEVWKASGPGGFHLALKFVRLADEAGKPELRALELLKGIRHPHLLAMFGAWHVDEFLIIAMELADRTLLARFREAAGQGLPGIPAPEVHGSFLEAAEGLDFLNEPRHPWGGKEPMGIQHRDIKPQNLLLVGGSVKVADFGLARVLEHSQTSHTGSMTPAYAAPEFFSNQTSNQSDQYSLAVTYCHLRGGRLPFSGNPQAVVAGHMHRAPDLSMVPEAERPAVGRALAKVPKDRWPSCRGFIEAVRLGDRRSDPGPLVEKAARTETTPVTPGSRSQRGRWLPVGSLLALLRAAGLGLWAAGLGNRGPSRSGGPTEGTSSGKAIADPGAAKARESSPSPPLAVYSVELHPPTAHLTAAGDGVSLAPSGSGYTVKVLNPDPAKPVRLVAALPGYREASREGKPKPGETESFPMTLEPLGAVYAVTLSPPEAHLAVRGDQATVTGQASPYQVVVRRPDGQRSITLVGSLDGYEDAIKELRPEPDDHGSADLVLRPKPATYRLDVEPAAAQVKVEGEGASVEDDPGDRRLVVDAPNGKRTYVVVASLAGYKTLRREVTPAPGEQTRLRLRLETARRRPAARFAASIGIRLVAIPAGSFRMGTAADDIDRLLRRFPDAKREDFKDEQPAHEVRITRPFLMAAHEVTVGQFRRFVEDAGYQTEAVSIR